MSQSELAALQIERALKQLDEMKIFLREALQTVIGLRYGHHRLMDERTGKKYRPSKQHKRRTDDSVLK